MSTPKQRAAGRPRRGAEKVGYHHGDLRAALLRVAGDLLERDGLAAISLRAVAQRAGVSQTAFYRHFANKEALLAELAKDGFIALERAMTDEAAGQPDRVARFKAFGRGYVRFALDHPGMLALMFGSAIKGGAAHPELIEASRAAFRLMSEDLAALLAERYGAAAPDPRIAALTTWSMVHGLSTLLLNKRVGPDLEMADLDPIIQGVTGLYGDAIAGKLGHAPPKRGKRRRD